MTKSETSPTDPLRHWSALGTTDPTHTKPFQRAGGFRGTAIRPIESVRRMTEHFGPAGIGWGMEKPEFQVVSAGDELLVFCTLQLWYSDPEHGNPAVWGVGGDKVTALVNVAPKGTRPEYKPRNNDEAFKSAYTDALGNAMKHIGVAADIHMGRFDDSKYVREVAETFKPTRARKIDARAPAEPDGAQLAEAIYEAARSGTYALRTFWGDLTGTSKRDVCLALGAEPKDGCPAQLKAVAERADAVASQAAEMGEPPFNSVETAT